MLTTLVGIMLPVADTQAHAFGVRYDLPIPLWLYLAGAGAIVALTFVGVVMFAQFRRGDGFVGRSLGGHAVWAGPMGSAMVAVVRCASVAMFAVVWAAAAFGIDETFDNLAPTTIWVIWWLGLAYVSALFGNLWGLINPLDTIFRWGRALVPPRVMVPRLSWPRRLGLWPAAALLLVFAWIELISEFGEAPRGLAWLIAVYAASTLCGMALFGRSTWLRRADVFAIYFGLFGRFGIFTGRLGSGAWPAPRALRLRLPVIGVAERRSPPAGQLAFIVVMLATVSFDGFRETPAWQNILSWVSGDMTMRPLLLGLRAAGIDLMTFVETFGLVLTTVLFFAVYMIFACGMAWATAGKRSPLTLAAWLASSLVPIAIAYHLAHYVSYFLLAGQLFVPLISDPFGLGWNLFGTAAMTIDVTVVNARMVWYIAVVAVVLGHMAAVIVAHTSAIKLFADRGLAQRSQIPMLTLMVIYTMTSLWILSQPVVMPDANF